MLDLSVLAGPGCPDADLAADLILLAREDPTPLGVALRALHGAADLSLAGHALGCLGDVLAAQGLLLVVPPAALVDLEAALRRAQQDAAGDAVGRMILALAQVGWLLPTPG